MLSTSTIKKTLVELSAESNKNSQPKAKNDEIEFDYDFAFQPIVDISSKSIFAHEALVRGRNGSGAETVLNKISNNYLFDQASRVKAIKSARKANLKGGLSINFMPNAVFNPARSLLTTLESCYLNHFPTKDVIFEFNEKELVKNHEHILSIGNEYKRLGFKTAIDDFGAGYSGLNFIANFQPDMIKIDMGLIRHIDQSKSRQAIIKAVARMCRDLDVIVIAEGIETAAERDTLLNFGIHYFQGNFFCKPSFQSQGIVNEAAWLE
jgi:EAL domain-containing protein (putative c-di-GMP-specific phosphodiesterase class I)